MSIWNQSCTFLSSRLGSKKLVYVVSGSLYPIDFLVCNSYFLDKTWFTLNGNVNSQNNIYWCFKNPHAFHEVAVHDLKVGIWCAVSACKNLGPMFFKGRINNSWIVVSYFSRHQSVHLLYVGNTDFFMLFIPCIILQLTYHPTYALCETPFMTYRLLHVLAPRCHPQWVTITKVCKSTCQSRILYFVDRASRYSSR